MPRNITLLSLLPLLLLTSCLPKRPMGLTLPISSARTPLELQLSQVAWDHAQCFLEEEPRDPVELEKDIQHCKGKLLDALSQMPEAKALRDYFALYYPTAADAFSATTPPTVCKSCDAATKPRIKPVVAMQQFGGSAKPASPRIEQLADWIAGWVSEKLTYKPDSGRFMVSLPATSYNKDQAKVTLYYLDGQAVSAVPTQSSFEGLYRGIYRYTIEKPGYASYDSGTSKTSPHLNLVDWDSSGKGLSCQLVKASPGAVALPCSLQ